jgi:hypothetical protein
MGGKSTDKPETMDVEDMMQIAREESRNNERLLGQQTTANRPEQINPYGKTMWEDLGGNQWRQTTTLNPDAKRALKAREALGAGRTELAGELFDTAAEDLSAPIPWEAMQANEVGTGAEARQSAEDAIYGRSTSRLDPAFEQKREQMQTQLWNQGLRPGDEAYDTATGNLDRQETDAYQTAMRESIMGGGQEASRTFGMDMQRRQQALAEQLKRRGQSLSEVNALQSGTQVAMPEFGGFSLAGRAQGPALTQAAQLGTQNAWDKYSARQGEKEASWQGATDIVAAVGSWMPWSMGGSYGGGGAT